jgi:hypothetical protein
MNKKASELMDEPVSAGVTLEAKGSIKRVIGSAIGGAVGEALTGIDLNPAAVPRDHQGIHYVAIGPTKVGFFSMKRGLFRPSIDELLVQHPRSDVQAVEIKRDAMPAVHFVFRDGTNYVLMCPRIHLGKLKKVQEILTSQ